MSSIAELERQIMLAEQHIRRLEQELEGLYAFREENNQAVGQFQGQLAAKQEVASRTSFLDIKTTLAPRLNTRMNQAIGASFQSGVFHQFDEVHTQIWNAINQVDQEIEQQRSIISNCNWRITEIRLEEQRAREAAEAAAAAAMAEQAKKSSR